MDKHIAQALKKNNLVGWCVEFWPGGVDSGIWGNVLAVDKKAMKATLLVPGGKTQPVDIVGLRFSDT